MTFFFLSSVIERLGQTSVFVPCGSHSPVCSNMCLSQGSVSNNLFMLARRAAPDHTDRRFSAPRNGFLSFFFFYLFLKIIFLWFLTVGRSGSKRCADWLMAVNHQWLRHGGTHVFYICELCCRSAHPVLRGSAWIIALKWSFNIDL